MLRSRRAQFGISQNNARRHDFTLGGAVNGMPEFCDFAGFAAIYRAEQPGNQPKHETFAGLNRSDRTKIKI
jgi:hypothetical protein